MKAGEYLKYRLYYHSCASIEDAIEKLEADKANQAHRFNSLMRDHAQLQNRITELSAEMNETERELQYFSEEKVRREASDQSKSV